MKKISPKELTDLLNNGFEGSCSFTADILFYGDGMPRVNYSGDLVLQEDFGLGNTVGKYKLSSPDPSKFNFMFARAENAVLVSHCGEDSVIHINVRLPMGYVVNINNSKNIFY